MKRALIFIIAVCLILFFSGWAFIYFYGKDILIGRIEKDLGLKVSIASFKAGLPARVKIKQFNLGAFLSAEEVNFSVNPLGFLAGKIILDGLTLNSPLISLEQSPEGSFNFPSLKKGGKNLNIIPLGITLKNARLVFNDRKIDPGGMKVLIDNLDLSLLKADIHPFSLRANYSLSGIVKDENGRSLGALAGQGWLDFRLKDMDGYLELKDLDLLYFKPYYGNFISKRGLLSASLNLRADLESKNDDLKAFCRLELFNLAYQPKEEGEKRADLFSNTLDLFADSQGSVILNFRLSTSFSRPVFDPVKFRGAIVKAAGQNLANQPADKIMEKIGSAIGQFKEMFKKPKNKP